VVMAVVMVVSSRIVATAGGSGAAATRVPVAEAHFGAKHKGALCVAYLLLRPLCGIRSLTAFLDTASRIRPHHSHSSLRAVSHFIVSPQFSSSSSSSSSSPSPPPPPPSQQPPTPTTGVDDLVVRGLPLAATEGYAWVIYGHASPFTFPNLLELDDASAFMALTIFGDIGASVYYSNYGTETTGMYPGGGSLWWRWWWSGSGVCVWLLWMAC